MKVYHQISFSIDQNFNLDTIACKAEQIFLSIYHVLLCYKKVPEAGGKIGIKVYPPYGILKVS